MDLSFAVPGFDASMHMSPTFFWLVLSLACVFASGLVYNTRKRNRHDAKR